MRNISVRIILAVLLVASIGCAKVLTAKTRIDGYKRFYNKSVHGYQRGCWGFTATVKYNPETDRGSIDFGDACPPDENDVEYGINDHIYIRVYDSDGFLITIFNPYTKVEAYWSEPILSTPLSKEARRDARRIEIDFDDLYWSTIRTWVDCPAGREFNENEFNCDRICPDDKFYDKYTDKCLDLYDSKETAAYEPPDEPVDTQVADVSSYWPGYGPGYDTDNYKTDGNTYYDQWRKEQWKPEPDSDCPINKMIGGRCQY